MFSYEFCEISKNTFFTEHLWATSSGDYCYIIMPVLKDAKLRLQCFKFNPLMSGGNKKVRHTLKAAGLIKYA